MYWIFNEFYVMIYTSSFIYYSLKSCIDHMTNAHTTKRSSKCPKKVCKSMNESDDLAHTLF